MAEAKAAYVKAKKEWDANRGTLKGLKPAANGQPIQRTFRLRFNAAQAEFLGLTNPAVNGRVALDVRDSKAPADTEVRIRGEAERLGPVVPRGCLSIVNVPGNDRVNGAQSGRLELARWLTSTANPLTPRVMANRVWQHLIGRGIVSSVDNFGSTGDIPTHPELLDHLQADSSATAGRSRNRCGPSS